MTNDLKPVRCGCGGETIIQTDHDTIQPVSPVDWKRVVCTKCNIRTTWRHTEAEAITAWNKAMSGNVQECAKDARCTEQKWHINFDPYDESTSPKEKGYYRIIEEDGTEKTDFFFGEPRMTGHGIGYWATSEKTIIAWARLEWE